MDNMAVEEVAAKSSHVADPVLEPFLRPDFSPADYLNSTLPALSFSPKPSSQQNYSSLSEVSSQSQIQLSQLNAHTVRLSSTLTTLADDILRSGGRLAYQVELLRGEATALADVLTDDLRDDIARFVPDALIVTKRENVDNDTTEQTPSSLAADDTTPPATTASKPLASAPVELTRLRTLVLVRERLSAVISVFGEATRWPLAPSEVSLASSFISVSGPADGGVGSLTSSSTIDGGGGTGDEKTGAGRAPTQEEKGRAFAEEVRREIADLAARRSESKSADAAAVTTAPAAGYEAALARIAALRELAGVWRGTVEERARLRFVDGLVKIAEEKGKHVRGASASNPTLSSSAASERAGSKLRRTNTPGSEDGRDREKDKEKERGLGFLENLQRIRGNLYIE